MNDVTFVYGQGGLGAPLSGEDFISGIVFYDGTLPSGFTTTNNIKEVLQISDAEALGIVNTNVDEMKATGTYLVTATGAAGDTINISVNEPFGLVSLGTYTRLSTDTTATILGASIAAFINSGTATHGYTATAATGTVTITARPGLGVFLNSGTPIVVTIVGTIAGTLTQFSSGVGSKLAIYHYHISEYFRMQPQGALYVGFFPVPGTFTGAEVQTIQTFASGKLRQVGVYYTAVAYASSQIQALQSVVTTLEGLHMPLSVIYGADISAVSDLSTLATLQGLNSNDVTLDIGQDGVAVGGALYASIKKSITTLGNLLGCVSLASVSTSIAYVAQFNVDNGTELDTPAFANGQLVRNISANLQNQLNTYKYVFLRTFVGNSGTYYNNSHTATIASSDYAFIERNRTIDKAIRQLYIAYLPLLNGPLVLNADGTLDNNTVALYTTTGETALDEMLSAVELSNRKITVDPTQNVFASGKLFITATLQPVGVAQGIQVKIGYSTNIS